MTEAARRQAIDTLVGYIDPVGPPLRFVARLEGKKEFYWVTVFHQNRDLTQLVAQITELPLVDGRFRNSILEIMDKLTLLGITITNFRIVEEDED